MITSLQIQNYALINNLNIDLDKGLSIITGETGAGKSIILGAMSLIMGNRADTSVINDSSKKCVVEATFNVADYKLQKLFEKNEIDYFETAIVRREISPEGRSRAFINDTPVNLTIIKEILSKLIDIHSQHDTLTLNDAAFQIGVIDLVAKNTSLLNNYKRTFKQYKKTTEELDDLINADKAASRNYDYYNYQFKLIENANLVENEQEELEKEQKQLSHTEEIKSNLTKIIFLLNNENNAALNMLKEAAKSAENILDFLPKAKELHYRLDSAFIDLQDLLTETEVLENDIEFNPERFDFINNRLDKIYSLQQKFNADSIKSLIQIKNGIENQLLKINSYGEQIVKKKEEIELLKNNLTKLATKLNENRNKAKNKFQEKITYIVENLGMPNTKFDVEILKTDDFTPTGTDKITFLFQAQKNYLQLFLMK